MKPCDRAFPAERRAGRDRRPSAGPAPCWSEPGTRGRIGRCQVTAKSA